LYFVNVFSHLGLLDSRKQHRKGGEYVMENSFIIDENKKCFLNGQELTNVTNVDIKNINALDITEVVITVAVKSIDVKYKGLVK
jgi:hypothetical protein